MRTTRMLLAALAGSALLLAGCGGDDSGAGGGGSGEGSGVSGALEVTAADTAFDPTSLSAPAGEIEVTLTNEDGVTHTFTIDDLDADVEVRGGSSGSVTFEADPGTYEFRCRIHSSMTGELTVE